MENPSEQIIKPGYSQALSRRTFLEVTTGLFAAYTGSSLRAASRDNGGAPAEGAVKKVETPICILRLDPNSGKPDRNHLEGTRPGDYSGTPFGGKLSGASAGPALRSELLPQ